jgi:hypothetical protein
MFDYLIIGLFYYFIYFIEGHLEDVIDETKTLRELKPFQNIIKFSKKIKHKGQYHHLKEKVGESLFIG